MLRAGEPGSPAALAALERLCRAYWYPLYAFARRRGLPPEDAKDSTQAFFEALVDRPFIHHVARERGRFRTFLLTAFKRFLVNEWRRRQTLKRGGGQRIIPLEADAAEEAYLAESAAAEGPDRLYDHAWARTVIEHALRQLEAECARHGRTRDFRTLSPFLSSPAGPGEYARIGTQLGLSSHAVAAAVQRVSAPLSRVRSL
ncbi:MAG: ECF-type sigma factor [Verrucomicrobia bacterium]|nr:ECF-type sigma factor [Verrucomicrobiota bacterium]